MYCRSEGLKWTWLQKQGAEVNPCNSALHPAVLAGLKPKGNERSVQEAYNPSSQCFGCGARAGRILPGYRVLHLPCKQHQWMQRVHPVSKPYSMSKAA